MGFSAPWFLTGLAAIALPIYIHLLRQHHAEPLRFSSLMFFEKRVQSSVRRRRLQHWLLFALRAALIGTLALSFADPFIRGPAGSADASARVVVLAVDHSFSMRAEGRLERAKREAMSLAASLPPGSRMQVISLGSGVKVLTQPVADLGEIHSAIASIEASDSRAAYAELAQALKALAPALKAHIEVHLFSDMQRSGLPASFADLTLPEGVRLIAHPVSSGRTPNWTVETVDSPHRIYDPAKVRIQATIAGFGAPPAKRRVSLVVGGKTLETREVDVPASGRAPVEFTRIELPHGFSKAEVRLEPGDALPDDDRFLFSLERVEPQRILFVHEPERTRALLYVRAALEAASGPAFTIDAVPTGQTSGITLDRYSLVILSDTGALPGPFLEALKNRVRLGGGLFVAAGSAMASRSQAPVLGVPCRGIEYAAREGERYLSAGFVDSTHPVLRNANQFQGVKFFETVRFEPGSGRVLARLSNQSPLLIEGKLGAGNVLLFASTLDNLANDFPLHAAFVPFVEQTALYLAGLQDSPASHVVDSYYELRAAAEPAASVEVLDPFSKRILSLGESAAARSIQLIAQGYYQVRRANGRNDLVAVNADRRESDLETLPADAISLWQNTGAGEPVSSGAPATARKSLWRYFLAAALAILLVESALSTRYLGDLGEQRVRFPAGRRAA